MGLARFQRACPTRMCSLEVSKPHAALAAFFPAPVSPSCQAVVVTRRGIAACACCEPRSALRGMTTWPSGASDYFGGFAGKGVLGVAVVVVRLRETISVRRPG